MTNCKEIREAVLEAAISEQPVRSELREHMEGCTGCRQEWESMRDTMALLDTWEAPEPSPFFDTKLNARLRAEAEAAPLSWKDRIRAAVFGLRERPLGWRPLTAGALAVAMAVGISIYQVNSTSKPVATAENGACAVVDLQDLDKNQQLLNDLTILDDSDNEELAQ
jgi:hypothetical protein